MVNAWKWIRALAVLAGGFGVFGRIIMGVIDGRGLHSLGYFTIQSNLLAWAWLVGAWILTLRQPVNGPDAGRRQPLGPALHGMVLVAIVATGLIYNVLLAPLDTTVGLYWVFSFLNHTVTPLFFLADWVLWRERKPYTWPMVGGWLLFPAAYAVFGMVEGSLTGSFRYFFLDYRKGLVVFLTNFAMVLGAFLVLGTLAKLAGNAGARKQS